VLPHHDVASQDISSKWATRTPQRQVPKDVYPLTICVGNVYGEAGDIPYAMYHPPRYVIVRLPGGNNGIDGRLFQGRWARKQEGKGCGTCTEPGGRYRGSWMKISGGTGGGYMERDKAMAQLPSPAPARQMRYVLSKLGTNQAGD